MPVPTLSDTPTPDTSTGRLPRAELEALRSRDPEAVRRYIYENRGFLLSILRRFTKTEETTRPLLQETFLQVLRSVPNFRGDSKLSTWLYSVTKNVALARYRKDTRQSLLDEETLARISADSNGHPGDPSRGAPSWDPAEETMRNEEVAILHEALETLSRTYREVITLRDLEELSTEETAERLDLTRVNVRVRLHRARKKLGQVLNGHFEADYQMTD